MTANNKPEDVQVEVQEAEHIAVQTDTFEISEDAVGRNLSIKYFLNWRFVGLVIAAIFANNSYIIPYIYAANATPQIIADFGESVAVNWISLSYNLCYSVSLLLFGRLADIFGRRYFVVGAHVLAVLGCIVSATAKSANTIVGGQVLTGFAAAVQSSFTVWLAELIPKKLRPLINSSIYLTAVVGYAFGPAMTRQLLKASNGNWRWVFYFPLILNVVALVLFTACYFPPPFHLLHVHRSRWDQFKRTDFGGLILFTAGLLLFLMGLSLGGNLHPWKSATVISMIVVGGLSLVAFVFYEMWFPGDQIMPTHLFKARGFVPMVVCASVGSCVILSSAIIWPQEVNNILPGSADQRSWLAAIQTSCTLLGLAVGGFLLVYIPHHKYILVACTVTMTSFIGATASVEPDQTVKGAMFVGLSAVALGIVETASRSLLPLSCPDEDIGATIGIVGTCGFGGSAVATAMYVAILTSKLKTILPAKIEDAALSSGLPSSSLESLLLNYSTNITAVPGITPEIIRRVGDAVRQGNADAYRYVWYAGAALGACSIISSFFVTNYSEFLSNQVARKLTVKDAQDHDSTVEAGNLTTASPDEKSE